MTEKIKAAIIGPGNIGTDLLMKAMRSEWIDPIWMVGVVAESPGLLREMKWGLRRRPTASTVCCPPWFRMAPAHNIKPVQVARLRTSMISRRRLSSSMDCVPVGVVIIDSRSSSEAGRCACSTEPTGCHEVVVSVILDLCLAYSGFDI